jgi:flagellar biogenesis protein FliO
MKIKKLNLIILSMLISTGVFAEDVNVKSLDLVAGKGSASLSVKLTGSLNDNPELKILGKNIELKIPNAHVNAKISKKVGNIFLTATQVDRSTVRVAATLPTSLAGQESLVSIVLKDEAVELTFPSNESKTNSKVSRSPSIKNETLAQTELAAKEAEKLDENYLQNLEKENNKLAETNHPVQKEVKNDEAAKTVAGDNQDRVKLSQSSVQKASTSAISTTGEGAKSSFSVAGYIGKFVAFLAVMLLGFYGVLTLFKKGVIKKGKLGFLHSTKLVEVLSTTHIAPKRTLMMVKAHKQVFLISSSETGVQLISEIGDVAGLIKTGEAEITGSNFDTNLTTANTSNKEFKLKEEDFVDYDSLDEMLNEPTLSNATTSAAKAIEKAPVRDSVRLSDQIKTKVKNLKQLT